VYLAKSKDDSFAFAFLFFVNQTFLEMLFPCVIAQNEKSMKHTGKSVYMICYKFAP